MAAKSNQASKTHQEKYDLQYASVARPMRQGESPLSYILSIHRALRDAKYPVANVWDIPGAQGLNPFRFSNAFRTFSANALRNQEQYLRVLYDMLSQPQSPWGNYRLPTPELYQMAGSSSEAARASAFISGMHPYTSGGYGMPMNLLDHAGRIADALGRYRQKVVPSYDADAARRATIQAGRSELSSKLNQSMANTRAAIESNPAVQADAALADAQSAAKQVLSDVESTLSGTLSYVKWALLGVGGIAALLLVSRIVKRG